IPARPPRFLMSSRNSRPVSWLTVARDPVRPTAPCSPIWSPTLSSPSWLVPGLAELAHQRENARTVAVDRIVDVALGQLRKFVAVMKFLERERSPLSLVVWKQPTQSRIRVDVRFRHFEQH